MDIGEPQEIVEVELDESHAAPHEMPDVEPRREIAPERKEQEEPVPA